MKTQLLGVNSPEIVNIFKNRGVNPDSIFRLGEDSLESPYEMKNLKEAVELVKYYIEETDTVIAIQQDPDADGYMSAALVYNYLSLCYPGIEDRFLILLQDEKDHNINTVALYKAIKTYGLDVGLVIAPDCSSNEPETHKDLREQGIDVVVLDHHDASEYSEHAVMVNPSLDDYPNKNISGVGVCQKFADMYDREFNFENSKFFFDLVAIGMIGDMIEIVTDEAIYMVQEGMRNVRNKMLKAIQEKQSFSLGDQLTPTGVAFYIAPLINAMTRVGTMEEKQMLAEALVTEELVDLDSTKRGAKTGDKEELHQQTARIMSNIKSRQDRQRNKAMIDILKEIEDGDLDKNQVIMIDTGGAYPDSFNGLLANQVRPKYELPVMMGKEVNIDGRIVFKGSSRGDEKSALPKMKTFLQESKLVDYAEGHEPAHGFQFPIENKQKIIDHFNKELEGKVFEPVHKVDFDKDYSETKKDDLIEITRYSTFWAKGLDEPRFCMRGVPVSGKDVEVSGSFDSHIVKFKTGPYSFISFGVKTKEAQLLKKNALSSIDVVGVASINTYGGETTLQIRIEDFEIKENKKYVF